MAGRVAPMVGVAPVTGVGLEAGLALVRESGPIVEVAFAVTGAEKVEVVPITVAQLGEVPFPWINAFASVPFALAI